MPRRALTICLWPVCGQAIKGKYCDQHEAMAKAQVADTRTPQTGPSIYKTQRWKDIRHLVLLEEPICQLCNRAPSKHVDHIIAINNGGVIWDRINLQGLCASCHARKTAKEDGRWGRPGRVY